MQNISNERAHEMIWKVIFNQRVSLLQFLGSLRRTLTSALTFLRADAKYGEYKLSEYDLQEDVFLSPLDVFTHGSDLISGLVLQPLVKLSLITLETHRYSL